MLKNLRSLLLTLLLFFMVSACDVSQEDYAPNDSWCKFYGTCDKKESAACSLYGNCPSQKKTKETDMGCSLYGRCEDEHDGWW